jgi:integrase
MEEGYRKDNPARQTRRPKRRPTEMYRLTRDEAALMLQAAGSTRERRAIFLGICAGLRNQELRGLQGRHFERKGWIWVSSDIAKGRRERWLPVIAELEPIVDEIRKNVASDEYVIPAQRKRIPGPEAFWVDRPLHIALLPRRSTDLCSVSEDARESRRLCIHTSCATPSGTTSLALPG